MNDGKLVAAAVLSGNRNFEGRVNPDVKANYLASPPLVVAYALAGTTDIDLDERAARQRHATAEPVILADIWPTQKEIAELEASRHGRRCSRRRYGNVFDGNPTWNAIPVAGGELYEFERRRRPTSRSRRSSRASRPSRSRSADIAGARVLAMLGDSVTTDHISPAGDIALEQPGRRAT